MMTTIKNTMETVLNGNANNARCTRHTSTVEETAYMYDIKKFLQESGAKLYDVEFYDDVTEVNFTLKSGEGEFTIIVEVETNNNNEVYSFRIFRHKD